MRSAWSPTRRKELVDAFKKEHAPPFYAVFVQAFGKEANAFANASRGNPWLTFF
jgi:hypothetical protein